MRITLEMNYELISITHRWYQPQTGSPEPPSAEQHRSTWLVWSLISPFFGSVAFGICGLHRWQPLTTSQPEALMGVLLWTCLKVTAQLRGG